MGENEMKVYMVKVTESLSCDYDEILGIYTSWAQAIDVGQSAGGRPYRDFYSITEMELNDAPKVITEGKWFHTNAKMLKEDARFVE
jgi:hypothetical protein